MRMKKYLKYIITIAVVIALAAVVAIYYKKPVPEKTNSGLTAEERAQILQQLQEASEHAPKLTEDQRADILKELQESSKDTKPLTDEERKAILESLQQ